MKKTIILLLLSISSFAQVKVDGVDYAKAWIYTTDVVGAKQTEINNLNAEVARLKAIIAGTVVTPPPVIPPSGTSIFEGSINAATIIPYSGGSTLSPWYNTIRALGYPEFGFQSSGQYTKVEMITEGTNKALKAQIIANNPNDAGRFQASTYLPSKDLGIYHTTQRMKFGPDVAAISSYSGAINSKSGDAWFTIFETWMGQSVSRMNLSLNKASGAGNPIRWELMAEWEEGSSTPYRTIWSVPLSTVPVPFGKWFTMDVFIKSGEGTNGQVKVIITVDGEAPVVLFDVKNTTIAPGYPTTYRRKTDHMKFYIGKSLRAFMLTGGKNLEVFYGDYKILKD